MKTRSDYYELQFEIGSVALKHKLYSSDEMVDHVNVMDGSNIVENSEEYWDKMYLAACSSAGLRAEESGFDLHAALGRVIY